MTECTVATLCFRDPRWLDWWKAGLDWAVTRVKYRTLVLANDATDAVRAHPIVDVDFRNPDPAEHYIVRVYRAWNEAVLLARTPLVCLMNNDMWPYHGWLDELVEAKRAVPNILPCSLLVENGRIPSGIPEHVRDFGTNPENFNMAGFAEYAKSICKPGGVEPGRLFQPVLFNREEFLDLGGYPEGNLPDGTSGDRDLFARAQKGGLSWATCQGSVVYHCQEGETRWPGPVDTDAFDPVLALHRIQGITGS